MRTQTLHANVTKTAIGYVRVSTQEQATEGVSLDAQRDRLRSYCKANGIRLIDIIADEGLSGSTLERPGLQAALHMIRRGRANTLIVVKLDRLSRSLRDVCVLVEDYFADERYHLLSVCGMVNTHTAAGRMLMMNLANFNQFEREMISERTRDALQHMKAQGVLLGHAPYGYEYAKQLDDKGRRILVPLASEQEIIRRITALHAEWVKFNEIARRLNADQIRARRGGDWCGHMVSIVLQREGKYSIRLYRSSGPRPPRRHDKPAAAARAHELRAQGMSLREIGVRLRKEGLVPLRGGKWHPGQRGGATALPRPRRPSQRGPASERATGAGDEPARSRRAAGDGRASTGGWRDLVSGAGVCSVGVGAVGTLNAGLSPRGCRFGSRTASITGRQDSRLNAKGQPARRHVEHGGQCLDRCHVGHSATPLELANGGVRRLGALSQRQHGEPACKSGSSKPGAYAR